MAKHWLRNSKFFARQFSSALFIPGNKAQDAFRVLTPHFDFEDRIQNKLEIDENIKARGKNFDLNKVCKLWNFYKTINETKELLELTKNEIGRELSTLMKETDKNKQEIDKLKIHSKLAKDDLKNVKDYLYGLEEDAIDSILSLPNILHPNTPYNTEKIIHTYLEPQLNKPSISPVDIALKQNLIEIENPTTTYLKGNAALFETAVQNYFNSNFLDNNFIQFSNADFVRSIVVEGCGINYRDETQVFTLEDKEDDKNHEFSRIHLVGGASLCSFMAYFTKHQLQLSHFPLKCYAIGRQYKPVQSDCFNFFNAQQDTSAQIFVATLQNDQLLNESLNEIYSLTVKLYEGLGYHFRLVCLPANKLHNSESLRYSIQMFSCYLRDYVEVANVSVYDEYISKRLLFTYNEDKSRKFPKIISGSLLNVHKLLGCVLEYNCDENDLLSELLKRNLPFSLQ